MAENRSVSLTDLSLADLQSISEEFGEEATAVFNFTTSLSNRAITGGTSPEALAAQLAAARQHLS
jgi:argininosuccinate lyase